ACRFSRPFTTIIFVGAHVFWCGITIWHGSRWHVFEQPSSLFVLPSSHSSPGSTIPSPQRGSCMQVAEQPSPEAVLPSSHCSPGSRMRLPQISRWHDGEQPSPATLLPSSHCSLPSLFPSPQTVS